MNLTYFRLNVVKISINLTPTLLGLDSNEIVQFEEEITTDPKL